jgi:hypothetical protein
MGKRDDYGFDHYLHAVSRRDDPAHYRDRIVKRTSPHHLLLLMKRCLALALVLVVAIEDWQVCSSVTPDRTHWKLPALAE